MNLRDYLTRDDLPGRRACYDSIHWLDATAPATVADAVATCPRGEWLLWLAERVGVPLDVQAAAVRPAVFRAVRVYAANACELAGLTDHAAALRALPDDAHFDIVRDAANAAWVAADAADAAWVATAAAGALWVASAASNAALVAASAADSAYAAAEDDAIVAALRAARAAPVVGFAASEHALCAADVRAAIPDLAERIERAMEALCLYQEETKP